MIYKAIMSCVMPMSFLPSFFSLPLPSCYKLLAFHPLLYMTAYLFSSHRTELS